MIVSAVLALVLVFVVMCSCSCFCSCVCLDAPLFGVHFACAYLIPIVALTSPRHCTAADEDGLRVRDKAVSEDPVDVPTPSRDARDVGDADGTAGWDVVARVEMAGVGVSIVSNLPREMAYCTIRGVQVFVGMSLFETVLRTVVDHMQIDDMLPGAAFSELLVPQPTSPQARMLDVSIIRTLVSSGIVPLSHTCASPR